MLLPVHSMDGAAGPPGLAHHAGRGQIDGRLFERWRQPAVAGEIRSGVIRGPRALGLVSPLELTSSLAEIGVIFLLFTVGLELKSACHRLTFYR